MSASKKKYLDEVHASLKKELGLKSPMAVPKIEKVVISLGCGEAVQDRKKLDHALEDLTLIAGQKPVATTAKKSIAGFKLRDGMKIGAKVTLRNDRMYEFLDRLIYVALPRVKDFRGLSAKSFDGRGNYSLGIKEQIVFPEIYYDKVDKIRGFNICVCTSAKDNESAKALLKKMGFPLN